MGWNELDDKLKRRLDKSFVSCDEDYELRTVKNAIKEEMPDLGDFAIDRAIQQCCEDVPAPHPREAFIACLRSKLGS